MTAGTPAELLERLRAGAPGLTGRRPPAGTGLVDRRVEKPGRPRFHYIVCHTGAELADRLARRRRE